MMDIQMYDGTEEHSPDKITGSDAVNSLPSHDDDKEKNGADSQDMVVGFRMDPIQSSMITDVEQAVLLLVEALQERDCATCYNYAMTLADLDRARTLQVLLRGVNSQAVKMHELTLCVLEGLASEEWVVEDLITIVDDDEHELQVGAVKALETIADPRAAQSIFKAFERSSGDLQEAAQAALIAIGDGQVINFLMQIVEANREDWNAAAQEAFFVLTEIYDTHLTARANILSFVGDVLQFHERTAARMAAATALGMMSLEGEEVISFIQPVLIYALDDPHKEVRRWVKTALEMIDTPEAQAAIAAHTDD